MRKLILNYFALGYTFKSFSILRAPVWIFSSIFLYMITAILGFKLLSYFFMGVFFLFVLIAFLYLNLFPITKNDIHLLTDNQWIQYSKLTQGEDRPIKKYDDIRILLIPGTLLILVFVSILWKHL